MSMMRRPSPFGELLSLRQAMDRLFEESFVRPRGSTAMGETGEYAIPLDIYTTGDSLVLEAALPGVKPDDVEITVLGDTLTISGSSSSEERTEQGGYLYQEVRRGSFSRTVSLPADLKTDAAQASFDNGMLRLTIPKAEQARPRQIRISPTSEGAGAARQIGDSAGRQPTQGAESVGQPDTRTSHGDQDTTPGAA
jgi:HSP20 family protein